MCPTRNWTQRLDFFACAMACAFSLCKANAINRCYDCDELICVSHAQQKVRDFAPQSKYDSHASVTICHPLCPVEVHRRAKMKIKREQEAAARLAHQQQCLREYAERQAKRLDALDARNLPPLARFIAESWIKSGCSLFGVLIFMAFVVILASFGGGGFFDLVSAGGGNWTQRLDFFYQNILK